MHRFHVFSVYGSLFVLGAVLTAAGLSHAQPPAELAQAQSCEGLPGCDFGKTCREACGDLACDPCCAPMSVVGFGTVNGFKGPTDLDGLNGNFGLSAGANAGLTLVEDLGLGLQAGGSYTGADLSGTEFTGNHVRRQTIATLGFFTRPEDDGWKLGLVYDYMHDDYYTKFDFGQWRGLVGYQLPGRNEIGVWATLSSVDDHALIGDAVNGFSLNRFEAYNQINPYWQRIWEGGAVTNFWVGVADNHHSMDMVFGGMASCPLNKYLAVIGGFEYIAPGSNQVDAARERELWSVYTGLAIHFGGTARCQARAASSPVLPVADQGSFGIVRH